MKHKLLIGCLALLVCLPAYAERPVWTRSKTQTQATALDTESWIAVNKILMFVTNQGGFANQAANTLGKSDGLYFPFTSVEDITSGVNDNSVIFAAGVWMGGEDAATGDTLTVVAEYSNEYFPGPMTGGTFTTDADILPQYRIYRLYKDSMESNPNSDYTNWPTDQGAPVDSLGKPALTGDEMLWCVYTDANPATKTNDASSTLPLGIEVRQSIFAFDREDALGNAVFMRYRVYNKGSKTLNNYFISLWADPDLGGASDDFVGSDTTIGLGYCYNATNNDNDFGSRPPAVGFDFFQGPLVASPGDTAKMWGIDHPDTANMGMTSFNMYINGTDPQNFVWTYQYMNGLDASNNGAPLANGTKFAFPGDPVAGTGDLDFAPADRRWMQTTGPITFAPNDSVEIIAAVVVGQGSDRLTSISALKFFDRFAQSAYELDFQLPTPPAAPVVDVSLTSRTVSLSWTNASETNPGDFPFQGYTVLQGPTASGPWKRLANFDVNDDVGIIFDEAFSLADGVVIEQPVKFGSDNEISRTYGTSVDALNGGSLSNMTDYFFRVEAYSYDKDQTPKTLTSATVVKATPQQEEAGTEWNNDFGDVLASTNSTGTSDGTVGPVVIDPRVLNGHTYQVTFESGSFVVSIDNSESPPETTFASTAWNLDDLTAGTNVLSQQTNQSGNSDYPVIDGFQIKVAGPPLQGKDWDYTAADPVNISPVVVAKNPNYAGNNRWFTGGSHGGELMFGGIFMEPNFWGATTVSPGDMKTVEVRFRPMVSFTDLNGDGEYSIGEPYVVDDPGQTQSAFTYQTFSGGAYLAFVPVPFTAWDVTDPGNPRQLNIVVRDRDQNGQWDLHSQVDDAALPNGGDQRFNYTWILNSDYDATGTMYGDGSGGTIDFWAGAGGAVVDAMWVLWMNERGSSRGPLAEECTLTLTPNIVNTPVDTFTFVATAPTVVASGSENLMDRIRAVPNPYYLQSAYDNSVVERRMKFSNLPEKCTIKIFTLGGDLVASVDHDDPNQSFEEWNVESSNGIPIASGIYIYVVESDAFGNKIGKMAIFTEEEQLNTF